VEAQSEQARPPLARAVVAVASGKGGVGKSTISLNLGLALVERGAAVGLFDADFYGPDIPLMIGLKRTKPLRQWTLWQHRTRGEPKLEPVERYGLRVMSVGFLLAESQALLWPAQLVDFIGRQLTDEVAWGDLDFLIVDLPPGTADVQQQLLARLPLRGAIVVVGPQDAAHLDARKVLELFQDADVPILGGVENMAGLVCPHCGERIDVFPSAAYERSIWALGVPKLGSVPLDPSVAAAGDSGRPVLLESANGAEAIALREVASALVRRLAEDEAAASS
jgi:ATP-binding protein involved in chromosome partitioning